MKLYWLLFGFLLVLMACNTQPTPPKVVRIEVSPSALLLSKAGESQTLTAKAFDAQGNEVKASFAWSSTRLTEVTVDATGKVTAMGDLGSALVMAEAEGVKSSPATVLIAQPVSGAVLVADDQVLGQPQESVPDQEPTVGSRYKVLLNAAQTPGAIVLSSGSQPIAGKVVSSTASGTGFEVIIERRPVTEVFNRISVRLQGSLADVKPSFAGLTQPSQVQTLPDGRLRLSYAPSSAIGPQLEVERRIGPFNCNLEAGIAPSDAGIEIQIQRNLNFDFVLETEFLEVKQFRAKVEGSMGVSANGKLEFGALGLVELTCKATVFRLPIPVTGFLAAFISPVAPLGLKFSASGELKSTFLGIGLEGEAKLDATVGIDYTPEKGWVNLSSFETVAKDVTPKLLSLASSPITFEGKLGFQGTMGIGVGNTVAALEIIEVATGPVLEAALKPAPAQALGGEDGASNYKLNWKTTAAPGEDLYETLETVLPNDLVDRLKLVNLSFVEDIEIASSPTAADAITVDRTDFKTGDKLTFQVPLDPANLNFLPNSYNVGAVKIYRKNDSGTVSEVASQTATDGQKDFTLEWIAIEDGTTTDNFFAFVETKLLPFAHLKLGAVEPGCEPLVITTASLPAAQVGRAYAATLEATGGQPPLQWSATGLPAGLTMDAASGEIRGTPTREGTFEVRVVLGSSCSSAERTLTLTVVSDVHPMTGVWTGTVEVVGKREFVGPGITIITNVSAKISIRITVDTSGSSTKVIGDTSGSGSTVYTSAGSTSTTVSCGPPHKEYFNVSSGYNGIGVGGAIVMAGVRVGNSGVVNCNKPDSLVSTGGQFGVSAFLTSPSSASGSRAYTVDLSRPDLGASEIYTWKVTAVFTR